MDAVDSYLSKDISMDAYDSYLSKYMDDCACDSYLSKDISMDAYDSDPLLSEKDILYELCCGREPVLKDRELEAGYGACKKYTQIAKAPHVLRLQFDCATRLGFKDEAVLIALVASAQYEVTPEMYFALGEYFFGKKDLLRAWDNFCRAIAVAPESNFLDRENIVVRSIILLAEVRSSLSLLENTSTEHKKKKKKAFESTLQRDLASSSHPMESEKEQRTMASSASSVIEGFDQFLPLEGSESLLSKSQQKQAAPAQLAIVYQPLFMPMGVAEDTEVKGEKSIFLCFSNWIQGRYGCDWYRLDWVKKEGREFFGRLEWGGIPSTDFGVATVGSIIYILGGLYPEDYFPRMDWTFSNDVFYLDVDNPQDGWKAGPQLPSPHLNPVATSMNETVYIFNGKYVFARALDTSDSGSGWKSLADSPNLESPAWGLAGGLHFVMAFPDPIRGRIVLLSECEDLFAYYPRNEVLEVISYRLKIRLNAVSVIVDGVLYYNNYCSDELLCAYDLDQWELLTPIYSRKFDLAPDLSPRWDHLLDLGGGKLCLVGHARQKEVVLFWKLKVQKEAGGEVQITVLSFGTFRIVGGSCFKHSIAL